MGKGQIGEAWQTHPWVAQGQERVRFGIAYGPLSDCGPLLDWPALFDTVGLAEQLGADSYWTEDHPVTNPDCWTTLAALAISTKKIRLGPLVACVYYQTAAQIARAAADIDRLSEGRLILAVGIGDYAGSFGTSGWSSRPPTSGSSGWRKPFKS